MGHIRFVVAVGLVSVSGYLGVSAAAQTAPAANHGTFRFEAPARLTVKAACAIGLKNGDVLVTMTDAPIDCAAAARKADPQDAVSNTGGVAARVQFTITAAGKLGTVFLANVSGASTYSDDTHGVLKLGPKTPTSISGTVNSAGVHKVQLYSGAHDMEYDLTFNTPIVKAAR